MGVAVGVGISATATSEGTKNKKKASHQQQPNGVVLPQVAAVEQHVDDVVSVSSQNGGHVVFVIENHSSDVPREVFPDAPDDAAAAAAASSSSDVDLINSNNNNKKDVVIPNCFAKCCCSKCCSRCKQQPLIRVNQNVLLTLILDVLYGISDSLWGGTVFVAYLKRWSGGQNYLVGNVEAVNGVAVLLSALPVGYLADKYGRSRVIKAGGILIACTALAHVLLIRYIGTTTESNESKRQSHLTEILLSIVMALWGIGGGIVTGPCDALYADSTPAGERSKYYYYMFVCYMLASCCGPLLAIVLFQTMGDDWDLYHLQVVLYVGLSLEFCNAMLMLLFDDSKALDENTTPTVTRTTNHVDNEQPRQTTTSTALDLNGGDDNNNMDQLREPLLANNHLEESNNNSTEEEDDEGPTLQHQQRLIPYFLFFSSLVMAMGSGMTIKFFPLFFKDQVGFSPTQVQGIYVLAPLSMALFSGVATSVSRWFGRVQTIILLNSCGVACLLGMVFGFDHYFVQHKYQLVAVYLLRTALMNCTYPLYGSILMDFVPKQERARWKSLESIASFGWCGSAALGGYISDRWSYNHTFGVTAVMQGIGILFLAFLLPLVPRREGDLANTGSSANDSTTTDDSNNNNNNPPVTPTVMNGEESNQITTPSLSSCCCGASVAAAASGGGGGGNKSNGGEVIGNGRA